MKFKIVSTVLLLGLVVFSFAQSKQSILKLQALPALFANSVVQPALTAPNDALHYPNRQNLDTLDRDGDGIVDSLDKCPDEKGIAAYDGCPAPDSDLDGITDDKDLCPTISGTLSHGGCPAGDRDGDKISDDDDLCPDEPGVARFGGCLTADSDKDGVEDDKDDCKLVAGTVANKGCPELNVPANKAKRIPSRPVKK